MGVRNLLSNTCQVILIMSGHVRSCQVMSGHVMSSWSCQDMSYVILVSSHVKSSQFRSCQSCHVMSCHVMSSCLPHSVRVSPEVCVSLHLVTASVLRCPGRASSTGGEYLGDEEVPGWRREPGRILNYIIKLFHEVGPGHGPGQSQQGGQKTLAGPPPGGEG